MTTTRRSFIKRAGLFSTGIWSLSSLGCAATNRTTVKSKPNIIFIMSDDHASHAISAYGSKINKTPNIDRIAREGVRFDNCFCTNGICSPSRAVILTGKYSHVNGVIDNRIVFDGSQQTLPKILGESGYQTAIVGKWHLKSAPTGFDYSNVLPDQGDYHDPVMIENGKKKKYSGYVTDIITDTALSWLETRQQNKPFYMMLHHKAPHADWESDSKHEEMYQNGNIPEPTTFNDDYKSRTGQIKNSYLKVGHNQWELHFKYRFGNLDENLTEQETREWVYQQYMKDYLRCVASVDDNVGRLLDYLDDTGLSENTLVIYTSDQGFFLGDHGLYDKRFMYDEALRMPLLMRYPDKLKPDITCDEMVLNLDFASTILDCTGTAIPEDIQGVSFWPIAIGKKPRNWRKAMYYRFYEQAYDIGPHEGVRTQRYKLIHFLYGDNGWELYDLEKDPEELTNLYGKPEYALIIKKLKSKMESLKQSFNF